MKRSTVVVKRIVFVYLLLQDDLLWNYTTYHPLLPSCHQEIMLDFPRPAKKTFHATTCVWSLLQMKKQLCVSVMHQSAGEGSNFLQSSSDFVPLALCALCYFTPCQSLGGFVVTLGCSAVLQICVQMLWISVNGTLLSGKMTLSCSLVRVISVECIGCFWVTRMFWQEHCEVT